MGDGKVNILEVPWITIKVSALFTLQKKTVFDWFQDFMHNTSVAGLSHANNAKTLFRKIFWLAIFLGFLGW